ncbi:unnamed protein product [Polarella glacialis]|uniref:Uncharacterized protein n=1 Tax=Polarella glacialis TaxID=89957 RepID=A0A813LUV3_POLGL|nr:unnamed protein product [Polarella glacialis]
MAAMAAMALPEQGPGLGALESSWLPEFSPGRICFSLALLMVSARARSEVASLNGPWQILLSDLLARVKPAESETDCVDARVEQMLATKLEVMGAHAGDWSRPTPRKPETNSSRAVSRWLNEASNCVSLPLGCL